MITAEQIAELVPAHLARQRWYDHDGPPTRVEVAEAEQWRAGSEDPDDPSLWWMLVDAHDDHRHLGRYQLVVGARTEPEKHDFLAGKDTELIGRIGDAVSYDATIDQELAIDLLGRIAPSMTATNVRPLTVEQSNSSIVYDEKIIVKLFRRIHHGANPDVDAVRSLLDRGFHHVPEQLGVLERSDGEAVQHLAVAREFLAGATDGWHLALTSLRILFADHEDPAASGGDFAPDAARLGNITAQLHLAMADAFGTSEADPSEWVAGFRSQLDRVREHVPAEAVSQRYDEAAQLRDVGPAMRIHGDLHLAQCMRADAGWYIIDFEGEPARPLAERVRPSSPLRDVAGMMRSFHYAAEVARWEGAHDEEESHAAASAWEARARDAFLSGYLGTAGIDALLPPEPHRQAVLDVFELDKATYEVAYEVGFRPQWVAIPLGAIQRILS